MFGGQDHHHNSGPVSDRVAKERTDVPFLVADAIEHNPGQKNAACDDGETMPLKERLVLRLAQRKFHNRHLDPTEICSPPWTLIVLRLWRRGWLRWFAGIMFAWQISGLHAHFARCHVVIFWLRHSLKIFIEPAHDVLQALHAVPGLSGARKLMRFSGEAHHDDRT